MIGICCDEMFWVRIRSDQDLMVHIKTPKPTVKSIMFKKLIGLISMITFEVYSGNKVFVKFGENI